MRLLFDTIPVKPAAKKEPAPKPTPVMRPQAAAVAIGPMDGSVRCPDDSCQSQCHDIVYEERGECRIECCFCGTAQWVPAVRGRRPKEEKAGDFVFRGGRCDGMKVSEAPRDYIEWSAQEDPRPAAKKACQTYLAGLGEGL